MTNEEAIRCIDAVLDSDYHYDESLGYQLTSDDFEWLEKAKETLEKQIPRKPIDKTHPDNVCARIYENFDIIVCPTCGERLKLKSKGKYCDKCGQAIDWAK